MCQHCIDDGVDYFHPGDLLLAVENLEVWERMFSGKNTWLPEGTLVIVVDHSYVLTSIGIQACASLNMLCWCEKVA